MVALTVVRDAHEETRLQNTCGQPFEYMRCYIASGSHLLLDDIAACNTQFVASNSLGKTDCWEGKFAAEGT